MNMPRPAWTTVLLLLPSLLLAAEPSPTATAAVPVAPASAPIATDVGKTVTPSLTTALDLRGSAVRDVVRTTAARQSDTGYRVESAAPAKPDLAAALRQERPAPHREARPRLPDRPPRCDGFWSCGLDTLLGLDDDHDEEYGRQERHRLMNQGSFNDKSGCEACESRPAPTLHTTTGTGTELRPDRP